MTLTLPIHVKHLMLLLGGGTAQSTRRRRRKVIMPLNLNSKWDQVKRDMLKAKTQKKKSKLETLFGLVGFTEHEAS